MKSETMIAVLLIGIVCFLSGCALTNSAGTYGNAYDDISPPLQQTTMPDHGSQQMQRRFDPDQQGGSGTVHGTVVWAQRYEELSAKNNLLREKNSEMRFENMDLKQKVAALEEELKRTKIELAEANKFLQQMHLELNDWKSNVLGFREEMRQAQKGQLEALAKILRILGAEPTEIPENSNSQKLED